jgi:hypothetical protein
MMKVKKVKKTPEEERADDIATQITQTRRDRGINDPPPNRTYVVGQRLHVGALDECIVTEVHDGGRIVVIHCRYTENNYGRKYKAEKDMVIPWHHGTPWLDVDSPLYPDVISTREDRLHYNQTMIESLLHHFYNGGLDLNPDYQRDIVWTMEDKIALIDSIFDNVDIGKFVIARRKWTHDGELYEIIDGKQRFTTLMEFYESRWTWRGQYYHQLSYRDQGHFDNYSVSEAQIEEASKEHILKIFLKLNTTGHALEHAHLDRVRRMLEEQQHG